MSATRRLVSALVKRNAAPPPIVRHREPAAVAPDQAMRTALLSLIHQPAWLTMREARLHTGLGPTMLHRLTESGKVRRIVDGKVKLYRPDLDALTPEELMGGEEC